MLFSPAESAACHQHLRAAPLLSPCQMQREQTGKTKRGQYPKGENATNPWDGKWLGGVQTSLFNCMVQTDEALSSLLLIKSYDDIVNYTVGLGPATGMSEAVYVQSGAPSGSSSFSKPSNRSLRYL